MIETTRYLTNDLLFLDGDWRSNNDTNGMTDWILAELHRFMKEDFYEYNARSYGIHTLTALNNLFEFARNEKVRRAAQMTMDFIAAKAAVSMNGLRRVAPFRRSARNASHDDFMTGRNYDVHAYWFGLMAGGAHMRHGGQFDYLEAPGELVPFATGSYRVPPLVLDLAVDKSRSYYQRFWHATQEIYASTPDWLLAAGGMAPPPHPSHLINCGILDLSCQLLGGTINARVSGDETGVVHPTVLMPTRGGTRMSDLIAFEGRHISIPELALGRGRNNTCVAPGFACGVNPRIPARYLAVDPTVGHNCVEQVGTWTFLDLGNTCADRKYGMFVALRQEPCSGDACGTSANSYGTLEVVSNASYATLGDFKRHVLANNQQRWLSMDHETSDYLTVDGRMMRFRMDPSPMVPAMISTGGPPDEPQGLATGDVVNANRGGLVRIDNVRMRSYLVLDFRDPTNHIRSLYEPAPPPPPPPLHQAPIADATGAGARPQTAFTVTWTQRGLQPESFEVFWQGEACSDECAWQSLSGRLAATATSYTKTGVTKNRVYKVRVCSTVGVQTLCSGPVNAITQLGIAPQPCRAGWVRCDDLTCRPRRECEWAP